MYQLNRIFTSDELIRYVDQEIMKRNKHQNYTNFETFSFLVEIENDQEKISYYRGVGQEFKDHSIEPNSPEPDYYLSFADWLKEEVERKNPLKRANNFYGTLLNAAIQEINFYECAQEIMKEV